MSLIGRRSFLNWLGLGGLVPLIQPPKQPTAPKPEAREIVLLSTGVAGFQFHDGMDPEIFAALRPGDLLQLTREPENAYDPKAVAIHAPDGKHLGYIPRAENAMLAGMLDQGANLHARITKLNADAPTWERMEIDVLARM